MLTIFITLAVLTMLGLLVVNQASFPVWAIVVGTLFLLDIVYNSPGVIHSTLLIIVFSFFLLAAIKPLRLNLISKPLMPIFRKFTPAMSRTEREALEAGTIGWEGDLFTGDPDIEKLLNSSMTELSAEEKAFLDNQVNVACSMINDWDITHNRTDLPPELWQYLKDEGFFGLIIPKKYGGHEFSATAQMYILSKLYACSTSVASTVAVPNSLGPAELLLKYGTEEQKEYYLPRLAKGIELPCFALTGQNAGSDAASIPDAGVVCYGEFNGKEVLGVKLNWNKRYITLAPIATLVGLAFRLFDPENLLGKGNDVGITCALIPHDVKGVIKGRRHFPLNIAFQNGPVQGKDVFIPIDYLIGGAKMAGLGWLMLMECLSAGRAISLPSSALGGLKGCAIASGAYSRLRRQFSQPIAKFEGIMEPLARIAGNTYIIESALRMTMSSVDNGIKSGVAGAILKYQATERARDGNIDAMDIHGGKGIMMGPKNFLGRGYQSMPIGITVEGANILTRSLIIFGQGVIRCHPYVLKELESIRNNDLIEFDKSLWSHIGFTLSNFVKSFIYSLTDGYLIPAHKGSYKRYYQLLKRYSAQLAFLSDFCMITMGSKLKRKEAISARLGDMLSALYLASGVLQRTYKDGEPEEDAPLVDWAIQELFYGYQVAMQGVIDNFPAKWAKGLLKLVLFGNNRCRPSDKLNKKLANILSTPNSVRDKLKNHLYLDPDSYCTLGKMEQAFKQICEVEEIEKKILKGIKAKQIESLAPFDQIIEAFEKGIITEEEKERMYEAEKLRQEIISVDDFDPSELMRQPVEVLNASDIEFSEVPDVKKPEAVEEETLVNS